MVIGRLEKYRKKYEKVLLRDIKLFERLGKGTNVMEYKAKLIKLKRKIELGKS